VRAMENTAEKIELETVAYGSANEGVSFTVLGAVHGNEKCGPEAIRRVIADIDAGRIVIKAGRVSFMPVCNPRAYEQDVRFTERNLNRFMYPKDEPKHYEDYLDNKICPVLEETDYLLDLHSYTSPGGAFLFVGDLSEKSVEFAKCLGVPRFIYGWAEALAANDDVTDKRQAMGTTEYAREQGAVALTLECGNHKHPRGADMGYQAILNALEFLGIAEVNKDLAITDMPDEGRYNIRMKGSFLKMKEGAFTQEWKNMDFVSAGSVIARYEDGEELIMPQDGYIVLPKFDAMIGHEWFFWGVESAFD